MKGFNLVLAILIFLLAVTSAVFSFFLFEKRNQLVTDHGMMGAHFEELAVLFDKKQRHQVGFGSQQSKPGSQQEQRIEWFDGEGCCHVRSRGF